MKKLLSALSLSLLLSLARSASACEPIVPLALLFSGTLLIGRSLVILIGAIFIKAIAFALFEKTLPWYKTIGFMLLANVVSSLVGFGLSLSAASPNLLFYVLVLVYVISLPPAKRLIAYNPWGYFRNWSPHIIAAMMLSLFLLTWFLFGFAQVALNENESLVLYWILKFLYVYSALIVSLGLTTLWEEWVIAKLARSSSKHRSFLPTVLKANLVTFFLVMVYAALLLLPIRLKSTDFLVHLFK